MALNDEGGLNVSMPVAPAYGGMPYGGYNSGFGFGGDMSLLILLFLVCGGGWGGMFGGFGGGFGGMYEFPWLLNGQNMINANTNAGFDHAATQAAIGDLSTAVTSGFGNIQTALCGGFAGVNATVNGAQNALAQQLYTNQIADLERSFAAQTASTQGMNAILAQITSEACANRATVTAGVQTVLDKLCALELDGYKREADQLRAQLNFANLQASQVAQTAELKTAGAVTANNLVAELRSCPIPSQPVYGNQPIFTCGNGTTCGCAG